MKCGLNLIEPGACIHDARLNDPLCHDHAMLAQGRASLLNGYRADGAEIVRTYTRRLRGSGCWVPEQQEGASGMMPSKGKQ